MRRQHEAGEESIGELSPVCELHKESDVDAPERMRTTSGVARGLLVTAGFVCVGLGFAGIFLPLLPTTPFLLLAAACFARSSERFHDWLLGNRWFGQRIRDYAEHRATTLPAKVGSIAMLWACLIPSGVLFTDRWWVRGLLLVIGVGVTMHLTSLRTIHRDVAGGVRSGSGVRKGRTTRRGRSVG